MSLNIASDLITEALHETAVCCIEYDVSSTAFPRRKSRSSPETESGPMGSMKRKRRKKLARAWVDFQQQHGLSDELRGQARSLGQLPVLLQEKLASTDFDKSMSIADRISQLYRQRQEERLRHAAAIESGEIEVYLSHCLEGYSMGTTIHYSGTLNDTNRVEEMEDRVIDLVFALGGRATIWRSFADHDPSRVVRGLTLEMTPGQETTSLLVSPEGHFIPLFQIEEAEQSAFAEPPYCFVKTQYGSITGHVAIVCLLDALKQEYAHNMQICDEGEYYETRDIGRLKRKIEFLDEAMHSLGDGLRKHGLSEEAMEDPMIIAKRIERVAMLVQQKIAGQSSANSAMHATEPDQAAWNEPQLEEEVEWMDAQRRKNDLRSERMARRIAESTAKGMSARDAFELAMSDEGLSTRLNDSPTDATLDAEFAEEPDAVSASSHSYDDAVDSLHSEPHPAVTHAQEFMLRVMGLAEQHPSQRGFATTLTRGAMDIVGGLVQATGEDLVDRVHRALAITQLKRALFGHAYARGAVFGLASEKAITQEVAAQLQEQLESILHSLHDLMSDAWDEPLW